MQFEKEDVLNYCLIDLSDDDGQIVAKDEGFYVYNPEAIDAGYSHNIIFVHGYNTDFFYAMKTASYYYDILCPLIKGNANFIGIYWPGHTGVINFSKAVRQASASGPNFAAAINYIIENSKAPDPFISFIAHSLGNRECAQTILTLKSEHGITPVKNFIQLAPAIDANSYQEEFKNVPSLVQNIKIYFSRKDMILFEAYKTFSEFTIHLTPPFLRWGEGYGAMGFNGPYGTMPSTVKSIDANSIAGISVDHGTYLSNPKLIESVAQFINV